MPTVAANGALTLCHKGSDGIAMATLPDVCKTQVGNAVSPIPYPNIAKDADLVDGSEAVTADGGNSIAIQGCKFSQSVGDEPGSLGGVSSGCINGEAKFISFSPNVNVEGKPVARLSDKMTMNKENAACMAGILIIPVVLIILSLSGCTSTREATKKKCKIDKVQYKLNGSWQDVPSGGFTDIGKGTSITFKVISNGDCSNSPRWRGDARGTGETKQVTFGKSGKRTVSVTCCEQTISIAVSVDTQNQSIAINWLPAGYTSSNTNSSSTCLERNFTVIYEASADIDNNKWMLRVKEISGGADITVCYGGSRNAITNPPTIEKDAQNAVTIMKNYYSRGSRGSWHTEAASKSHEEYHYLEWKETCDHYWPATEKAIEKISVTYHDHNTEAAAIKAMKSGTNGANNKIVAFKKISHKYWFTLGDGAGDRPYAAGQLTLNNTVIFVQNLAATNKWTVSKGINTPSTANPCYQKWLAYKP